MSGKQLTHFLCLPLVTGSSKPQLQASFKNFAAAVESKYQMPDKAVRPVGALHLTIGVMNLPTEDHVVAASKFLESLDLAQMLREAASVVAPNPAPVFDSPHMSEGNEDSIQADLVVESAASTRPLVVQLKGLKSMHNPLKTSVLYTMPEDPTGRLQSFGESLRSAFATANLLVPDKRPLRMHATIVNTLYAKRPRNEHRGSGNGRRNRSVEKINATALLEEFTACEWAADVRIERVSICEMGAKKEIVDGVVVNEKYTEVATVPLP